MDTKTMKKAAEQFDALAEIYIALAGTFRDASGAGGSGSVDAAAGKSVPAKSVKSKPAAKSAPVEEDAEEVDIDTVRESLKALAETKGKEAMVAALAHVGAGKLSEVDESQYGDLKTKADELLAEEDEVEEKPKAPAKKTAAAKKTAKVKTPTLEEVQAAAKALIDADKPAYMKLVKTLGKPSDMDEADYADAIKAFADAMPEDEEEEEDLM